MKKIYVGNLAWSVTNDDLHEFFAKFGTVHSARVITDRDSGRSRGFGFVEMDAENADKAIEALNGADMEGRALRVKEAHDKRDNRNKRSW